MSNSNHVKTDEDSRAEGKENAVQADNQVVFRKFNERIIDVRNNLKETSDDNRKLQNIANDDDMSSFVCECSDENCKMKLHLSLNDYQDEHGRDDTFTIAKNHEVPEIEQITNKTPGYIVVQKLETPSQKASKLQQTTVDNSPTE